MKNEVAGRMWDYIRQILELCIVILGRISADRGEQLRSYQNLRTNLAILTDK